MLALTLFFVVLPILSASLTLGATIRNRDFASNSYLSPVSIGGVQSEYQRNLVQSPMKMYFQRNLRRFPREDHTSFEDDVADPVLASYSTSELIRILDLIDKIQNAQRAEARSDVELTSEEARTLRHLMNAYVK